ncbi:hypothetical protein OK016_16540 [Vibrio chagasii]|nr:hypothetical protein [Vibrio chagasii]
MKLGQTGGTANVAVLKSVVTQASSANPCCIASLHRYGVQEMREEGIHTEGCMEQDLPYVQPASIQRRCSDML